MSPDDGQFGSCLVLRLRLVPGRSTCRTTSAPGGESRPCTGCRANSMACDGPFLEVYFWISACRTCTRSLRACLSFLEGGCDGHRIRSECHLDVVVTAVDPHAVAQPRSSEARPREPLGMEEDQHLARCRLHPEHEIASYSPMAGDPSATPTSKILSACVIQVCVHGELTLVSAQRGFPSVHDQAIQYAAK